MATRTALCSYEMDWYPWDDTKQDIWVRPMLATPQEAEPEDFTGENFRKVTAQAKWNDINVAERKGDLPMTDAKKKDRPARCPDCVTEVRRGNTVLVFSGYFKEGATATAADKMLKVLEAESAAIHKPPFTA